MQTNRDLRPNRYTDETVLNFGIHKGKRLIDVPASYLKYLYDTDKCFGELKDYIKENIDVITATVKAEWDAKDNTRMVPMSEIRANNNLSFNPKDYIDNGSNK